MPEKRKSTKKPLVAARSRSASAQHYRELGGEGTAAREREFAERGSSPRGPELGEDEAPVGRVVGPGGRTVGGGPAVK